MNTNETINVLALIVKAFEKIGLALLFFLLAITNVVIRPLIERSLYGGNYPAWKFIGIVGWLAVILYIALGVMLLLRKYKPTLKIPEAAFCIVFLALALCSFINFIKLIQGHSIAYLIIIEVLNFLAFASMAVVLFYKKKLQKLSALPATFSLIVTFWHLIRVFISLFNSEPVFSHDVVGMISGIILTFALVFFGIFFMPKIQDVAEPVVQEKAPVAEAEDEFAGLENIDFTGTDEL
jgi:hypothetical protein